MTQYLVTKDKLDALAVSVSDKSGEELPLTIDGMREAVNGIEPNLQAKTNTISAAGTFVDTPDTGYDGLSSVTTTVPKGEMAAMTQSGYTIVNGAMKWRYRGEALIAVEDGDGTPGFIENDTIVYGTWQTHNAIAAGTSVTPTESAQTIGGSNTMMEGAVTVNAIPSNYVGSGITQRSSTDLSASGNTVSVPSGYYASSASKAVASGTEGTPTATKGAVSNHAVSVTPSVTNSAGYISGGTKTGTAVSVSASELVSGNKEITENGTNIDVTNYATVSVAVPTGGVTQDSNGFIVLPETGSGGGTTGLVYESGTYEPSADIDRPTISFTNQHTNIPAFVMFADATGTDDATANTNYGFTYTAFNAYTGAVPSDVSTSCRYGLASYVYITSTNPSQEVKAVTNLSGDTTNSRQAYWVTNTGFMPSSASTSRYWRAGRTYKWVAVWAPES